MNFNQWHTEKLTGIYVLDKKKIETTINKSRRVVCIKSEMDKVHIPFDFAN